MDKYIVYYNNNYFKSSLNILINHIGISESSQHRQQPSSSYFVSRADPPILTQTSAVRTDVSTRSTTSEPSIKRQKQLFYQVGK